MAAFDPLETVEIPVSCRSPAAQKGIGGIGESIRPRSLKGPPARCNCVREPAPKPRAMHLIVTLRKRLLTAEERLEVENYLRRPEH